MALSFPLPFLTYLCWGDETPLTDLHLTQCNPSKNKNKKASKKQKVWCIKVAPRSCWLYSGTVVSQHMWWNYANTQQKILVLGNLLFE